MSFLNKEKGVFNIISISSHIDQFSKYCKSYLNQISKSSVFLSFICNNHVMPGKTLSLLRYSLLKFSLSSTNKGLGPTTDISPLRTFMN